MSKALTCSESFDSVKEQLECIWANGQISDWQLQSLLTCRAEKKVDFVLVDIRELFEYANSSIIGTDLLLPTSKIHMLVDELTKHKAAFLILYCAHGNRSAQVLQILAQMGFTKIAHLSEGIATFSGATHSNAPLPNKGSK